jgi:hypothetical protein
MQVSRQLGIQSKPRPLFFGRPLLLPSIQTFCRCRYANVSCLSRLNKQHRFLVAISGDALIHPSIPKEKISAVADIGTGTGYVDLVSLSLSPDRLHPLQRAQDILRSIATATIDGYLGIDKYTDQSIAI